MARALSPKTSAYRKTSRPRGSTHQELTVPDTTPSSTNTVDALMQRMSLLPGLPMQADPFKATQPRPQDLAPEPSPKQEK